MDQSFCIRLLAIVNDLDALGDLITEHKVVLQILWYGPHAYKQMALAIELLMDLRTLSIEELTGRLQVIEERGDLEIQASIGSHLLLTEEEWMARQRQRDCERRQGTSGNGDKRGKAPAKPKT